MSEMVYFQIFHDMEELLEAYDDAQRGRILTAMMQYAFHGIDAQFEGVERFVWPCIRQRIDQSAEKLVKLRANGARGGLSKSKQTEANPSKSKQTEANPSKPKQTEANPSKPKHIKEKEQEQDKEQEHKESVAVKRGFTAPTPDDVRQFCKENGITGVDPDRFCDFYTAKGWKVGNSPMKDWHAAVRNWARSDSARAAPRPVRAQQYTQRTYTDNDLSFGDSDLMREAAYG